MLDVSLYFVSSSSSPSCSLSISPYVAPRLRNDPCRSMLGVDVGVWRMHDWTYVGTVHRCSSSTNIKAKMEMERSMRCGIKLLHSIHEESTEGTST